MFNKKKYPILITTIISCVIIIASLFILGFFGANLGVSLGGGSQVEVVLADGTKATEFTDKIGEILEKYDVSIDSTFVQDKFTAGENKGDVIRKALVVQSSEKVDDETATKIQKDVATALELSETHVSVGKITSSVDTKTVLRLGIAFGIIVAGLFIFGWIRYDVFAGIAFVISVLHNIVVYFSVVILSRLQLTVTSITALIILTLVMVVVLISIYEKFREASKQQDANKTTPSERMIKSECASIKPYLITAIAVVVFTLCLLIVPVSRIVFVSLNVLLITLVTSYTLLLTGPSTYVALVEIKEMNDRAILSRNSNINKAIKKKVKANNAKTAQKTEK